MISEMARVVGINRDKAIIAKETSSTCEGCHLSGSCMSSGDVRCDKTFVVQNNPGAKIGDRVEVGLTSPEFFISILLVYLLPLILLFAGFALGSHFGPLISKKLGIHLDPTAIAAALGLVLLGSSFALLYSFNRWCKKKGLFLPKILRVIP